LAKWNITAHTRKTATARWRIRSRNAGSSPWKACAGVWLASAAARHLVVYVVGIDTGQDQQRSRRQHHDGGEHPVQADQHPDRAQAERGDDVAGGVPGLVAAERGIEPLASDDAQCDCRQGRREDGAGRADQGLGDTDDGRGGVQRDGDAAGRDHDHADGQQGALGAQVIDQRADRRLGQDLGDVADGQGEADPRRVPVHGGLQEQGHVGSHAVLDVGQGEIQGAQPGDAAGGGAVALGAGR
jgi:hypothetical protein